MVEILEKILKIRKNNPKKLGKILQKSGKMLKSRKNTREIRKNTQNLEKCFWEKNLNILGKNIYKYSERPEKTQNPEKYSWKVRKNTWNPEKY